MAINILSKLGVERVKAALKELEGPDGDRIAQQVFDKFSKEVYPRLVELIDEGEEDPRVQVCIYGSGGMHRYFLDQDGILRFSSYHALPDEVDKAKSLGFEII